MISNLNIDFLHLYPIDVPIEHWLLGLVDNKKSLASFSKNIDLALIIYYITNITLLKINNYRRKYN